MVFKRQLSIWSFVGLILILYGLILTGMGIYYLFAPDVDVELSHLDPSLWWGTFLLIVGWIFNRKGFSLFEFSIAVGVVCVLALISYPFYTRHAMKQIRAQAAVHLMEIASNLEQYHETYDTYQGAEGANVQLYDNNSNYQFELSELSGAWYVVKAVPTGKQKKDTKCGTLILDKSGHRSVSGTGTAEDCF